MKFNPTYMICLLLFLYPVIVFSQENIEKIDGITLVAPPQPIQQAAIDKIKELGTEWICLVPYAFQRDGSAIVSGGLENKWWGESKDGISKCIEMARTAGMKILLKPQVWIRNAWVGSLSYKDKKDSYKTWEESYKKYILANAELAQKYKVEMLCIGTEYDQLAIENEASWRLIIKEVRAIYKGKITYSANWDKFDKIKFWDDLDYIGISAYFPLSDLNTPQVSYLSAQWKKQKRKQATLSKLYKKQILYTEYGYLSVDKCADKTWELEANIAAIPVNEQCQANAYEALFSNMWNEPFMAGGFLWKWFSYDSRREGSRDKEYDPQNKKAIEILKKYYAQY